MGEKDCELCQSYGCKVFGAYVLLCILAIIAYFIMEPMLIVDGNKSDKIVLIVGLLAWTAAMIVAIIATFAISTWREQSKAASYSEFAKEVISRKSDIMIGTAKLQHMLIYDGAEWACRGELNLPQEYALVEEVKELVYELINQEFHFYMLKVSDLQLLLDEESDISILENSKKELQNLVREFGDALEIWSNNPSNFLAVNEPLINLINHGNDVQALCKKYIVHSN